MTADLPSDPTLQKIRAICHDLAAHHRLDDDARDELCAHLEEKLLGYLKGQVRITEGDALLLVRAHFGDAQEIAHGIAQEHHTHTDKFLSLRINHARLYSVLLVGIGLSTALSIPLGLLVYGIRQFGGAPNSPSHIPTWLLPWHAAICGAYLMFIGVTLAARRLNPSAGQRLTRVLNYALLAAPPFGTLLGIYGLWKVDKRSQGAMAS